MTDMQNDGGEKMMMLKSNERSNNTRADVRVARTPVIDALSAHSTGMQNTSSPLPSPLPTRG